ncbi:HAD-IIB family hydrolase [Acidipila sp. EB88]|uniref:HAD-IIB family hydrolase n=1 Tax=Acidipila sp. EB88 TaxID=2305226 RepID=UPI000F5D9EDE|nr:HAD-IIB family hydrolase [Acidipila sp. EB88]RRA48825.1 HAD-IIB family hydrolase [Acidipila sp. EB88]
MTPRPAHLPPVALVAFDIDGTLLPTRGEQMSARTIAALRAAVAAGVEVVVATGRRAAYALPLLEPAGLAPETVLISSNGASTREFGGAEMHRFFLDLATSRALCAELRPFGGTMVFTFDKVGRGELVLESLERLHDRIALWVDANLPFIEQVDPLERVFDRGDAPMQGMICGTVAQMHAAETHLLTTPFAARVEMHRTEYVDKDLSILDILPLGCNKGVALARLAEQRGIARENVMAVGDNWNDLEMLRWAGQPVLMGNAAELLHAEAERGGWQVCATNDEDGAAQALEQALEALVEAGNVAAEAQTA